MEGLEKQAQRIFEFIVKNHEGTVKYSNKEIKNFIRWAWFYKRLFIVWAPASKGTQRIAALGIAWRSRWPYIEEAEADLSMAEKLEDGDYLYAFRVIVHPEFSYSGMLFQLLSMAQYRYPGVKQVFWEGHSKGETKIRCTNLDKLLTLLHKQVQVEAYRKWEKEPVLQSLTFAPSH